MSAGPLPKQGNSSPRKGSLLEEIEEKCNVDVDDVSTELIKSIPFVPHNRRTIPPYQAGRLCQCIC